MGPEFESLHRLSEEMIFADRGLEVEESSRTGRRLGDQEETNLVGPILPPSTTEIGLPVISVAQMKRLRSVVI